jgi:hypothetical protein
MTKIYSTLGRKFDRSDLEKAQLQMAEEMVSVIRRKDSNNNFNIHSTKNDWSTKVVSLRVGQ